MEGENRESVGKKVSNEAISFSCKKEKKSERKGNKKKHKVKGNS